MSNLNADKPAYPAHSTITPGLSKRELIAAMMAQGLISTGNGFDGTEQFAKHVSKVAVLYADALLGELKKDTNE